MSPFDMTSARYCHAGMPASVSCSISSACTLPLAFIWPRARVIVSMPSWPAPRPLAASPIDVSIGMQSSAAKPMAMSFCVEDCSPRSSNGVDVAKSARSASISLASSGPSIVVNAMSACSADAIASSANLPAAAEPAASGTVMPTVRPLPTFATASPADLRDPESDFPSVRVSLLIAASARSYPSASASMSMTIWPSLIARSI